MSGGGMADDYEYSGWPECEACGCELEYECCWLCHGDGGYHDCGEDCCCCLYPEDEDGDDWFLCGECTGRGELPYCPNAKFHRDTPTTATSSTQTTPES